MSDARTYQFRVLLGIDYNQSEGVERLIGTVPVYSDGRLVGAATLAATDGFLYGDVSLDYSTPERLTIETASEPIYLRQVGREGLHFTNRPPLPTIPCIGAPLHEYTGQ